jgi:hypothetical protein
LTLTSAIGGEGLMVNKRATILLTISSMLIGAAQTMAIEEAKYTVVSKEDIFEIRDYTPHLVAETVVEGSFEVTVKKYIYT